MKKVLIVDDEKSVTNTIASFFKAKETLEPLTAFTAEEAFTSIEKNKPEILLVDLRLGGKSGFDVMKFAKDKLPHIHIIVITGIPDENTQAQSRTLGAKHFLRKPIRLEELNILAQELTK